MTSTCLPRLPITGALRARRRARGVTLLELLIVLSIMAIIAAIVVPIVRRRRVGAASSRGDARGRGRVCASRAARRSRRGRETRVMLDLEQRTFQVERDARTHALPRQIELKLFTAQSDLVNEKIGAIRFFPDGGSNGGRVTLAAGERKFDVDVDWLTGRVAILD